MDYKDSMIEKWRREEWASEDQLQAACVQWFWNWYEAHRRMLFHVQQKARNAIEGARFKAIGVVRGPSDLVLVAPHGVVVWIEMKLPGRKQEKEQEDFEAKVKARGHIYVLCYSFKQFENIIYHYYGKPKI